MAKERALTLEALRVMDAIDRRGSFAAAADELGRVPACAKATPCRSWRKSWTWCCLTAPVINKIHQRGANAAGARPRAAGSGGQTHDGRQAGARLKPI